MDHFESELKNYKSDFKANVKLETIKRSYFMTKREIRRLKAWKIKAKAAKQERESEN